MHGQQNIIFYRWSATCILIKSNLLYKDCSPYLRVFVSQRDVTLKNTATTHVQRRVKIIKLLRIQQLVYLPNFAPGPNIFLIAHRLHLESVSQANSFTAIQNCRFFWKHKFDQVFEICHRPIITSTGNTTEWGAIPRYSSKSHTRQTAESEVPSPYLSSFTLSADKYLKEL